MRVQIFAFFDGASLVPGTVARHPGGPSGRSFGGLFKQPRDLLMCVRVFRCCAFSAGILILRLPRAWMKASTGYGSSLPFSVFTLFRDAFATSTQILRYRIPVAPEKGLWLNVKLRA